jgi:hypothetical protein
MYNPIKRPRAPSLRPTWMLGADDGARARNQNPRAQCGLGPGVTRAKRGRGMLARTRRTREIRPRSQPCGNRVNGAPAPNLAWGRTPGRAAVAFSLFSPRAAAVAAFGREMRRAIMPRVKTRSRASIAGAQCGPHCAPLGSRWRLHGLRRNRRSSWTVAHHVQSDQEAPGPVPSPDNDASCRQTLRPRHARERGTQRRDATTTRGTRFRREHDCRAGRPRARDDCA